MSDDGGSVSFTGFDCSLVCRQAGDTALEALEALKRGENTVSEVRALAEAAPYREKLLLMKEIERVGEESKAEGRGRDVSEVSQYSL